MEVKPEEIRGLLEYFSKNTYKARDSHPKVQEVMHRCLGLFAQDYKYTVISNTLGELSTNYPSNLVILEGEKGEETETSPISINGNGRAGCKVADDAPNLIQTSGVGIDLLLESESFIGSFPTATSNKESSTPIKENGSVNSNGNGTAHSFSVVGNGNKSVVVENGNLGGFDAAKLKDLCSKARFARCRARFPVPVILCNKTHICRSATLSGGPEIYGRSSFDYFFSGGADSISRQVNNDPEPGVDDEIVVPETQSDWQLFDRVRSQDIRLLKSFQVHTIVDLMVEKKKVKFGVNVTSSEKVDKENRYSEFNLISLPYPGCEFFKDYRDKGYNAEDLVFEWNQGHVDANIFVPCDATTALLNTDWTQYRNWDLVTLTQKYLKLLLGYVRDGNNGLLVHCISGWDRTPLFISLLRLSLWADGAAHKSLSAEQILYLTLAYDWLLFGHNLEDRLSKGEEILFFCFYFLKYIVDSEYAIEERHELPIEISAATVPTAPPPSPPTTPTAKKPDALTRVRNDSDIQLDGVLLDGDSQTSPEGSNWSLSSVGSSQSNKSQDNPPSYFQIPQDTPSSWEDCKAPYPSRRRHTSNNSNHSNPVAKNSVRNSHVTNNANTNIKFGNSSSASTDSSSRHSTANKNSNGVYTPNGRLNSSCHTMPLSELSELSVDQSDSSNLSFNLNISSSSSLSSSRGDPGENGGGPSLPKHQEPLGYNLGPSRTSPVAVPLSNSNRLAHQHRPESTSSASIGSWQLITGPGSMREAISSSDPGSNSSHSHHQHPIRLPLNGLEFTEASESSCTLVEELTPVDGLPEPNNLMEETSNLPFCSEAPDIGLTESGWKLFDRDEADTKEEVFFSSSVGVDHTPVNVTPTKEGLLSKRREKLQTVRAHFYTLYASAIGFKFRNVNDNGSSSGGLGFLIGNLLGASKSGNRTGMRTTNL